MWPVMNPGALIIFVDLYYRDLFFPSIADHFDIWKNIRQYSHWFTWTEKINPFLFVFHLFPNYRFGLKLNLSGTIFFVFRDDSK